MGHVPGSRVEQHTVHVQVAGTSQRVAQHQAVTGTALRYAIWCETPEEAYKALQDAIYRPLIQVKETLLNQISLLQITVEFPLLLPISKPIIQLERRESGYTEYTRNSSWQLNEVAQHAAVSETITYEKIDKTEVTEVRKPLSEWTCNENRYSLDLQNHHETKLTVRVRLDVNGDGSFIIPYETGQHWFFRYHPASVGHSYMSCFFSELAKADFFFDLFGSRTQRAHKRTAQINNLILSEKTLSFDTRPETNGSGDEGLYPIKPSPHCRSDEPQTSIGAETTSTASSHDA